MGESKAPGCEHSLQSTIGRFSGVADSLGVTSKEVGSVGGKGAQTSARQGWGGGQEESVSEHCHLVARARRCRSPFVFSKLQSGPALQKILEAPLLQVPRAASQAQRYALGSGTYEFPRCL